MQMPKTRRISRRATSILNSEIMHIFFLFSEDSCTKKSELHNQSIETYDTSR